MSYSRWAESDVYSFDAGDCGICMWCSLVPPVKRPNSKLGIDAPLPDDFTTDSRLGMVEHLSRHRVLGDDVPERAFTQLQSDIEEFGDKYITLTEEGII